MEVSKLKNSETFNSVFTILIFSSLVFVLRMVAYQSDMYSRLVTVTLVLLAVLAIFINKKEYVLLSILSLIEFDAAVSPHNVAPKMLALLCIVEVLLNYLKGARYQLGYRYLFMVILFMYYFVIGLTNFNYETTGVDINSYFFADLNIFICIVFSMYLFRDLEIEKVKFVLYVLAIGYILFVFWGYINNLKSLNVETREYIGYTSQLTLLIAVFSIRFFLHRQLIDLVILISIFALMVITKNVISQNLLIILTSLVAALMYMTMKMRVFYILLFTILLAVISNVTYISNDNIIHKITNITSIVSSDSLYDVSISPLIRILEMMNILSEMNWFTFFGGGFGSYFTDQAYPFPPLTTFDFSSDQINAGVYFIPHNFNYLLLKFGMLYPIAFIYLLMKINSTSSLNAKSILCAFLLFSMLNIGFTYVPSIIFGVVLSNVFRQKNNNA